MERPLYAKPHQQDFIPVSRVKLVNRQAFVQGIGYLPAASVKELPRDFPGIGKQSSRALSEE